VLSGLFWQVSSLCNGIASSKGGFHFLGFSSSTDFFSWSIASKEQWSGTVMKQKDKRKKETFYVLFKWDFLPFGIYNSGMVQLRLLAQGRALTGAINFLTNDPYPFII
jgi:hypothetical protein